MGLLDVFFHRNKIPEVTTILPDAAKNEIWAGRLPILNTNNVFLKTGEKIHLIDKAVNLEEKTVREHVHYGGSAPGLFKGTRYSHGFAKPIEHIEYVEHRGILYITNQRIIFQAREWGFDRTYHYLTAITPYSNAIELQFGNKTYQMIVHDGNTIYQALQLIRKRRSIY